MWVPGAVRYYFILLQKQEYILQWNWSFFGAIYSRLVSSWPLVGHACPGSREYRAGGQQIAQSRALAAGWSVPAGCAHLDPDLVSRTHFPRDSTSLAHSSEKGPPLSGARHHMAPASRSVEPPCVAPEWDVADLSSLPPTVGETITQARAPSTRQTYALKWSLFANWCSSHREDPRRCTIGVVLYFLQERLERRLSLSTLKCMWPLSRPTTMQWTAGLWESMISSWGSWRVPGGWTPPGHAFCPLGTSLSSWLDFRWALLSRWTQSSWNACLLRQRSWQR